MEQRSFLIFIIFDFSDLPCDLHCWPLFIGNKMQWQYLHTLSVSDREKDEHKQ